MDIKGILELLKRPVVLNYLATFAPVVGPGTYIASNLEWSGEFTIGMNLFYTKHYTEAALVFGGLDEKLPNKGVLTPAKINELFCLLKLSKLDEFMNFFESSNKKFFGTVLWNLAAACCRLKKFGEAEKYLCKWFESPYSDFEARGKLILSILQSHNGKEQESLNSFNEAWNSDKEFCKKIISKFGAVDANNFFDDGRIEQSTGTKTGITAQDEVISVLKELLVPRAPERYPQLAQQLSQFEYQQGYLISIERFGDGDIDGALQIINGLLSGNNTRKALLWNKAAFLLWKREWESSIKIIEGQLNDINIPGGVLWNAACAYFNLRDYDSALAALRKATGGEYRTSPQTWFITGLLAHLCGANDLRNHSINEAVNKSSKFIAPYIGLLTLMGIDTKGFAASQEQKIDDKELVKKYQLIKAEVETLLKQHQGVQAAQKFSELAPNAISDIGDIRFEPVILPTCPAQLQGHNEIFRAGVVALQKKAYNEAVGYFEDLYDKTGGSYPAAVNLGAALIFVEKYTRSTEVLLAAINKIRPGEFGGAKAIGNLITAYVKANKLQESFTWFEKLHQCSDRLYFDFKKMAYVAHLIGKKDEVATALYNACTQNLQEPSIPLQGAAVKACLEVKDNDRADALVHYFIKEKPLPSMIVSGSTRPFISANECKKYSQMYAQLKIFERWKDQRAAMAYFKEVHAICEKDYAAGAKDSIDNLLDACTIYGRVLFWNEENDKALDILAQAIKILSDQRETFTDEALSKRYYYLAELYFANKYFFAAKELCTIGLEADRTNKGLSQILLKIDSKIEAIPEKSRDAMRQLSKIDIYVNGRFNLELLTKTKECLQVLSDDFKDSRSSVKSFADLIDAIAAMESLPAIQRKETSRKTKETAQQLENELYVHLPKIFATPLSSILSGIIKRVDEILSGIILPEFTLAVEPIAYYKESAATLVLRIKNSSVADIKKLKIKLGSESPESWAPINEEQSFELVKKDESILLDWPVDLYVLPQPDQSIKLKITSVFTGGSLKGENVKEEHSFDVIVKPFMDIDVNYPVLALRPEECGKLYGRASLIGVLTRSLSAARPSSIPFLQGVRKVGKTSIFYFLAFELSKKKTVLPVYVNFEKSWTNPYEFIFNAVCQEFIKRGLTLPSIKNQPSNMLDFENFLVAISADISIRIVLLFDEFKEIVKRIKDGSVAPSFLGDLRNLYQNPIGSAISIIAADWHRLDDLKESVPGVPAQIWADFALHKISFLTALDAREAILLPAQESALKFDGDAVTRIYFWTNGYPWHIQWVCSELVNLLNTQKRYVVLPQDVDFTAQKLLSDDMLFNEGVCRPERLNEHDQAAIFGIIALLKPPQDMLGWFERQDIPAFGAHVSRLIQLEILRENGNKIGFCSPLHAKWFDKKRLNHEDIYLKKGASIETKQKPNLCEIPHEREKFISEMAEKLRYSKNSLCSGIDRVSGKKIFNNRDYHDVWKTISTPVIAALMWDYFLKGLRDIFINDMECSLNDWSDRDSYPLLYDELVSIRKRRNYVEHRDSTEGKAEELKCCTADISKNSPVINDDWLRLQISLLKRLEKALQEALDKNAAT